MGKRFMISLMICLAVFSVVNAERTTTAYEKTINVHDSLGSTPQTAPEVPHFAAAASLRFSMLIDYIYEKAGVILAYRHPPVKKPPAKYPRQAAKSYHYTSVIHKPWRLQYA